MFNLIFVQIKFLKKFYKYKKITFRRIFSRHFRDKTEGREPFLSGSLLPLQFY